MIEIQETGSYFEIDPDGYLVNPASVDKIQDEWRGLVDEMIEVYKKHFGENLVTVYLRGSVAKGEAIKNISDVDSWAYVDMKKEDITQGSFKEEIKDLKKKYSFCEGIEAGVFPLSHSQKEQFWIAQAVPIYGRDLQTEKFKVGKELIRHAKHPERIQVRLENNFSREDSEKNRRTVCTWLCKQILRSVMELCFEHSGKYSRDLYRCWETFSEHYPDKSDELREVLRLALNPISNKGEIIELEKKWTRWIIEEKKNLGY